jgi:hypothetical protein
VSLLTGLLLGLVILPGAVAAQLVTGTVLEAETGTPVAGAFVRIEGVRPGARTSFLTGEDGRYQLQAGEVENVSLIVERIGYERLVVGPIAVEYPGVTRREIRVSQTAIELTGITVESDARRCSLDEDEGGGTQVVWSQVRTALNASSWTGRRQGLSFQIMQRQRRLDPGDGTVLDETRRRVPALAGNSVRSLPVEDLVANGYVRTTEDGNFEYFAPDAEVVLSEEFLSQHCFGLRRGEGPTEGKIGLVFEPIPGRELPDVSGVAWVDEATSRLDFLEFGYTGLPYDVGTEFAGGRVYYEELPDGRWIVRDWAIQAPAIRVVQSDFRSPGSGRGMVEEIYETGAEVVSLTGDGFEWSQDLPTVELRGSVYDSIRGEPLAGATVRIAGRGWRATTDGNGDFALSNLAPGRYRAVLEHPRLDSLGLPPLAQALELAGQRTVVELAIPSRWTLLARGCEGEGRSVVGRVRSPEGSAPALPVRVVAEGPGGEELATGTSTEEGDFRLCGLPAGPLLLRAELAAAVSAAGPGARDSVTVEVPTDGYAFGELTVSVPLAVARGAAGSGGRSLSGTVTDASNGSPVGSADVEILDEAGTVIETTLTDAEGRFAVSLDVEEVGASAVRVRVGSLGFGTALSDPIPESRSGYRLRIELPPDALELEGVTVSVEAQNLALDRVGFYQREERVPGRFLERTELSLDDYSRMSEALLRVPGLQQVDMASLTGNTTRRYLEFRGARASGGRNVCLPAVYVDGAIVRFPRILGDSPLGQTDAGGGYPSLDELISAFNVEAIELYDSPSEGPPEFTQASPPCGSIVVWTRR